MTRRAPARTGWRGRVATGLALAALASLLPPARAWLEASMLTHMLVQWPLLVLAGAVLAARLCMAPRCAAAIARWNERGLPGLLYSTLALAFWMTPAALDHAVASAPWDAAKAVSLLAAGAALALSWRAAGPVVQAFFIGNAVWMTVAVGMLFQELPQRVCNAYLQDDQTLTGVALVALASVAGMAWATAAAMRLHRASELSTSTLLPHPQRRSP